MQERIEVHFTSKKKRKHPVGKGYGVYQAESMEELRQDVVVGLECLGYKDQGEYQLVWIQNDLHFVVGTKRTGRLFKRTTRD
ncbi:hypothetical protein QOT17_000928 [Balamuthia mandrillaris]